MQCSDNPSVTNKFDAVYFDNLINVLTPGMSMWNICRGVFAFAGADSKSA